MMFNRARRSGVADGNLSNAKKQLARAFSNSRLILAPAAAFASGGTATGLLFCSRVARRSAKKKTSGQAKANWKDYQKRKT
jgi:hypothetical protein